MINDLINNEEMLQELKTTFHAWNNFSWSYGSTKEEAIETLRKETIRGWKSNFKYKGGFTDTKFINELGSRIARIANVSALKDGEKLMITDEQRCIDSKGIEYIAEKISL